MPDWSNEVPPSDGPRAMPLKRTPTSSRLVAVITTPDLIGTCTHFFHGHTMPHERQNCPACKEGLPWTWHGYVGALNAIGREHFIFEFTAQVGDTLKEYRALHGTLRGCQFLAERMNHRFNGRVCLRTTPGDLARLNLPDAPDLIACMALIWNVPKGQVKDNGRVKDSPAVIVDPNLQICDRLQKDHAQATRENPPDATHNPTKNTSPGDEHYDRILQDERAKRNGD